MSVLLTTRLERASKWAMMASAELVHACTEYETAVRDEIPLTLLRQARDEIAAMSADRRENYGLIFDPMNIEYTEYIQRTRVLALIDKIIEAAA